jgi:RND family efflux transporter MFP subunit
MTSPLPFLNRFALLFGCCLSVIGCTQTASVAPPAAPTPVNVSRPVEQYVTDYAEFTGRTAAVDSVEVRARVWGYLDKVNFKEGELVKKGDVLFEIDPRTYEAHLRQAEGNLASMEARLKRLDADLERAKRTIITGAMSRENYDKILGEHAEVVASLQSLRAAVELARLDLGFTKVTAPVSGRVGRALVTVGNLIQSGQTGGTVLTTLVSVDPIYVYFDVDERTVLRVRQLIREGRAKSARETEWHIALALALERGYPHEGTINFVDNQLNPRTGTLRIRGVFPNKDEAISPGFFGRVRVPIGFPHRSLQVSDRSIDTDQGQKIVYVVNKDNKVLSRPVQLGALHDGLRVIEEGLKQSDRVLVSGLQQVRPGDLVEPTLVDMPAHNPKSETRNPKQVQVTKVE